MNPEPRALSADDLALLERLAVRVVELRMEVPAILALESARPLSLVAGQAMLFFEPLVRSLFAVPEYRRYARLIEDRDALEHLTRMIERRAEQARMERAAARRSAGAGDAPGPRR